MNIVWIGNHQEGLSAFKETLENGKKISAFITLDETAFVKRSAGSRDYRKYCMQYHVPYYTVHTIKGDTAWEIVKKYKPDLLVVLGWSEILPERILCIPTIGTVGTHAALLPHNKGSAPINWALIRGESVTGNTMMWLSSEVDSGEIIDQMEFPVTFYDSCKSLYEKVAASNAIMLKKLINNLENGNKPVLPVRNATDEPLLPRRRPNDGLLYWNQTAEQIYNFIRALTAPYPGAFTYLNGKKWLIWKASLIQIKSNCNPGEIIGCVYGFCENTSGILVGTEEGMILIIEIEDENGRTYADRELMDLNLKGHFENA